MSEEREVEVIIVNEKSAWDFAKSRRAISFIVWLVVVGGVIPLLGLALPDVTLDVPLIVEYGTNIVIALISGYTLQDVITGLKK